MIMQGYDLEAAIPFIAAKMRKEGVKAQAEELHSFIRRATQAEVAARAARREAAARRARADPRAGDPAVAAP